MSIDITVNETIESVDIVAVPNVQNVNITPQNIVENIEIVTQPNVYEVNITRVIGGGAVDTVNGQTGDVVLNAGDVGAYTTGQVDTFLLDKFDNPTGDNSQYLDGAGTPVTFPTIPDVTGFVPYTGATQDVDLGEHELKAGQIEFDQTPTSTSGTGIMRWNDQDGTVDLGLKGGNVTLQIGQESVIRVVNKTGANLLESDYQAVRVDGAQGNRLKVALAQATNDLLSAETIGLVTETINNNQEGFVTTNGLVRNINTTGSLQGETWADGDMLYLSPTVAGRLTKVKPVAPNHLVVIGYVVRAHATQGQIFVKVDNGYELDELHNVAITTPANNNVLTYNSATDVWENKTVVQALGFNPIQQNNWVNFTSTIVGFSSLGTNIVRYLDIGNAFIYYVLIAGTSNSTNLTFTIHYTPSTSFSQFGGLFSINNGASLAGLAPINLTAGSNIVTVPVAQNTGTSWAASGAKSIRGTFIVPKL